METLKKQSRKVGVAGGLINQMMGNNSSEPVVGKGATILMYSDRYAYEVISVSEDKLSCVIRSMKCTFVGSGYGDEQYTYKSNPNGETINIEWNPKKKCWGSVNHVVRIQKSLFKKLHDQYGWDWSKHLGMPYEDLIEGERDGIHTILKEVKGITKKYKEFHKTSIIFGVMEQYRDPSF